MEVSKQALQNIISDEERLLFAENIPAEYLSDALGRRTGTADALVFARSTEEVSGVLRYANENGIPVTPRGHQSAGVPDLSEHIRCGRYSAVHRRYAAVRIQRRFVHAVSMGHARLFEGDRHPTECIVRGSSAQPPRA